MAFMMVGDNHGKTKLRCIRGFFMRGNAGINRYNQFRPLIIEAVNRSAVQAITLAQPVRNIITARCTCRTEIISQHTSRCNAIHVVVPENDDLFPRRNCRPDHLDRNVHICQQPRVMQPRRVQKRVCGFRGCNAACAKRDRRKRRKAARFGQGAGFAKIRLGCQPSFCFHNIPL